MVVEDVLDHLHGDLPDKVLADDRLQVGIGTGCEDIDALTRVGISDQGDGDPVVFEPVPDGRRDGRVLRCRRRDHDVVDHERVAGLEFSDIELGALRHLVVVGDAIADVELEHRQRAVDEFDDALGAEDLQRGVLLCHHPVGGDDIIECSNVIAVEVRDQHAPKHSGQRASCRHPHDNTAPSVEENVGVARFHKSGRGGPVGVGNR